MDALGAGQSPRFAAASSSPSLGRSADSFDYSGVGADHESRGRGGRGKGLVERSVYFFATFCPRLGDAHTLVFLLGRNC
jgi:hypothetical protein